MADLRCGLDQEPPRVSPSRDSWGFRRSGSSSSATCSAKSPVSLQSEKSEPAESEERRLAFSLVFCSNEVEWSSGGGRLEPRFRKGMGTFVDGEMMTVVVGCPTQPVS